MGLCRNPLQRQRVGFGSRGLAPGHSNPPHYHKCMERLVLCGMPCGCDDSMNWRHYKRNCVQRACIR